MRAIDPIRSPMRRRKKAAVTSTPEKAPKRLALALKPAPALAIKPSRRTKFLRSTAAILLVCALLVSPEIVGQTLLICYGLVAVIKRYPLQIAFGFAVLFILLSPGFTWLTGSEANGTVLASYSFMFLGVGLIQLVVAYRRQKATSSVAP